MSNSLRIYPKTSTHTSVNYITRKIERLPKRSQFIGFDKVKWTMKWTKHENKTNIQKTIKIKDHKQKPNERKKKYDKQVRIDNDSSKKSS